MSYSMQPAQQPGQRPYSPYQQHPSAGSPVMHSPYGPPPAKRQRMSPDPRSPPNGVPSYGPPMHQPPNTMGYGNPYAPAVQSPYAHTPTYASSPPASSFHTPQPYQWQHQSPSPWHSQPPTPVPHQPQHGMASVRQTSPPSQLSREMMPPPPRPNRDEREERVGVEEIGDSLFGSGINLKDEENYLHSMYNNRHSQHDSFSTNQNTSFGSSTISPNNSFNLLTQGTSFGSQDVHHGALNGTLGQTQSQDSIELEQRRKRESAARAQAERRQHHLNNQFLQCNNVRKRMDRLAFKQGVAIDMTGCFVKHADTNTNVMMNGTGSEGIVAVQDRMKEESKAPESVVNQGTAFEGLISLISLAAGERIRGLLDETYTLARARRFGDHGRVVPLDFADIAEGEGRKREENVVPESVTGTQWDKIPDSATTPKDEDTLNSSSTPQPQPRSTFFFQGTLNASLRDLAEKDKKAEAARIQKREARKRAATESAAAAPSTTDAAMPDALDPDAPLDAAAPTVKMTKKEQAKAQKEKAANELEAQRTTNQTAAKFALGKKGLNRYAWMTGGAAQVPTNRFAKPTTTGTNTPGAGAAGGSGSGGATTPVLPAKEEVRVPGWGDFREDGVEGAGIQVRDWIMVLERDGKEKIGLQKVVNSLSSTQ